MFPFWYISLLLSVCIVQIQGDPRVKLSDGEIEGYVVTAKNGAQSNAFLGIPYARPPVGDLRFRKPVPPQRWTGILQCKKYKANCWQIHTTMAGEFFTGIEDCLYLNVFSGLNCTKEDPCPVMYYIHGGGFDYDTPAAFSVQLITENFANRGLVVVTIAYRLNAFGFWSSGGDEAMGNYGVHDMIAGLKWVQREIHNFGGDRQRVSIMGHSSGGMSVSILTLSPATKGLLHQAVMMSGNTMPGIMQNDLSFFRRLASTVNCTVDSKEPWRDWAITRRRLAIVDCMRKVDADALGNAFLNLQDQTGFRTGPRNDGPDGLFPKSFSQLIDDRRPIPTLTGTTNRESGKDMATWNETAQTISDLCETLVKPMGFRHEKQIVTECQRRYAIKPLIIKEYNQTENSSISFWSLQKERILSALQYQVPCYREVVSLQKVGAPVYLYSFDYEKTGQEVITPYHAFDLTFLIGVHMFPFDERDEQIKDIYARLIANFIKYGDPTPQKRLEAPSDHWPLNPWLPTKPYGFNYYSINLPKATMKPDFHKDDIIFWNYKVPLMENARDWHTRRIFHHIRSMDNYQYDVEETSLTDWQMAFWVVLSVLVSAVCATLALFIRFYYQNRRHGMANTGESQSLIRSDRSDQDDYNTFKM